MSEQGRRREGERAFTLVRPLSRLFVGDVFAAEQAGLGGFTKQVALWHLRPELCKNPDALRVLFEDLRRAGELSTWWVAQVLDVWRTSASVALATELLGARTLRQVLDLGRPVPVQPLLAVVIEAARALEAAHDASAGRPLIHGDLRPEHVLLGFEGAVKVTGFGFGRFLPEAAPDGRWAVWGDRCYQARERLDRHVLDQRTDLYSLGLVLLEAVTAPPGATWTDPRALLALGRPGGGPSGGGSPLAGARPVPADVARVVDRACAERPEDRYGSAGELIADLHAMLLDPDRFTSITDVVREEVRALVPRGQGDDGADEAVTNTFSISGDRTLARPTLSRARARGRWDAQAADSPFLGRGALVARVEAALAEVWSSGRGVAILLRGAPGMGRSRALAEIAARLAEPHRRIAWLRIAGHPAERSVRYAAVLRLIASAVGLGPDDDLGRLGDHGPRLRAFGIHAAIVDALRARLGLATADASEVSPPPPDRLAGLLGDAVARCVAGLCWEQPTVVAWDDLQWADDASLGCLYELLGQLVAMPALVLLTAPRAHALPWSLPAGALELELEALSRDDCERLILHRAGRGERVEPRGLERLVRHADGNPLRLEETVDLLAADQRLDVADGLLRLAGDPGAPLPVLELAIRRHLAELDELAHAVVLAAAVAGPAFTVRLVASALVIPEADVSRVVDELVRERLLLVRTPRGGPGFRREGLRQAVIAAAEPEAVRNTRQLVARAVLAAAGAGVDEGLVDHAAGLLVDLGDREGAARALADAAGRQEARGDLRGACERYARALELGQAAGALEPRAELALCMSTGRTALVSLNLGAAERALSDAIALADRLDEPLAGAEARVLLCRAMSQMERPGEAMSLAHAAMPLAERAGDRRAVARVCSAIAECHQHRGEFGPDIDPIERALRLASEEGDLPGLGHVLQLAAMHAVGVGAYGRTREVLDQARAIAARSGDPMLQCQLHRAEGVVHAFTGDLEGALKVNLEGVAVAHAHGLAEPELVMLHNCGDVLLRLGREREALYFFSESLRRCQATRFDRLAEANQVFLGFLEATCLDLEAGLRRMQGAINAARARGGRWTVAQGHRLMGEALLARGDRQSAVHHLEEALRLARKIGVRFLVDEAERCLARARPET